MTTPGNNPNSDNANDRAKANMSRRNQQRELAQQEKAMRPEQLLKGVPDMKYDEIPAEEPGNAPAEPGKPVEPGQPPRPARATKEKESTE